jgi:hypothetical protein
VSLPAANPVPWQACYRGWPARRREGREPRGGTGETRSCSGLVAGAANRMLHAVGSVED